TAAFGRVQQRFAATRHALVRPSPSPCSELFDAAVDVPGRYLQDYRPGTLSGSRGALMRVEPVGGTLGAVIHEVDLRALDDRTFDAIYETWLEHLVVFVRGQALDPAAHAEFARRFGELEIHPLTEKLDDAHPEVTVL